MKRYRVSNIKWINPGKSVNKIPKVLWLELTDTLDVKGKVSSYLFNKYELQASEFEIEDVSYNLDDFDITKIIDGMLPSD